MKIFFSLVIFFLLQAFLVRASEIPSSGNSSPLSVACYNVFEWQFNYDLNIASIGVSMAGLGNDDRLEILYDADHLLYHPEIKNAPLDFTSTRLFEFRISVSIDIWKLFIKK